MLVQLAEDLKSALIAVSARGVSSSLCLWDQLWKSYSPVVNNQLISAAESVLRPRMAGGRVFADVGAAVLSLSGCVFVGVSVDTPGWGLCAERSALAAMIAAGEYGFRKAVAVWRDPASGLLHILPPCGICREFMRGIEVSNLDAEIVLARNSSVRLKDLLPANEWPQPAGEDKDC